MKRAISLILSVIMILSMFTMLTFVSAENAEYLTPVASTESYGFEMAHYGVAYLGALTVTGGTTYGTRSAGGGVMGQTNGPGIIDNATGGGTPTANAPSDETVIGVLRSNLIANRAVSATLNFADAGLKEGDNYTVVAKVQSNKNSHQYNTQNISTFLNSGEAFNSGSPVSGGRVAGVTVNEWTSANLLDCATFDALPTYVDPTYGYEFKRVSANYTVGTDASVTVYSQTCTTVYTDYCGINTVFGLEAYNEDGDLVWSKSVTELYADGMSHFNGTDWGFAWLVDSGIVWDKTAGSATGATIGLDHSNYEAGTYAAEFSLSAAGAKADELVATLHIGSATREIYGADIVDGFSYYRVSTYSDGTAALNASIDVTANATVKLADLTIAKLDNVGAVSAKIDEIGNRISSTSATAITAAKDAYTALDSADQAKVLNAARIADAETALDLAVNGALYYVIDEIDALPDAADITREDVAAIEAARADYDLLTPEQQANVTNYAVLQALEVAAAALPAPSNSSKGAEVTHWGIPQLPMMSINGGAYYGVTGSRAGWGSASLAWVPVTSNGGNCARDLDPQYTLIGYSKVNLINCTPFSITINPSDYGIASGDAYTVKLKTAAAAFNKACAITGTTSETIQNGGNLVGISVGSDSSYIKVNDYDALPTYTDPQYGYEYKYVSQASTNNGNVTLGAIAVAHTSGVDFDFAHHFFGFEIYDKDGKFAGEVTATDVYNSGSITGGDWGAQWLVDSGYEWDHTSGIGYGVYFTPSEEGVYRMVYTMNISDIDAEGPYVQVSINLPDVAGTAGGKFIDRADVLGTTGVFADYELPFKYTTDMQRVEGYINALGKANVKFTNLRIEKLEGVAAVEALIDMITGVDDSAGILAADTAYKALTEPEKALVSNYTTLSGYQVASTELGLVVLEMAPDASLEFTAAKKAFAEDVIAIVSDTTLDDNEKDTAVNNLVDEFKFKNGVLNVRFQAATTGDALRLVSTIDDSYDGFVKAGFIVSVDGGKDFEINTTEVYESIAAKAGGIAYSATASGAFADTSVAFITATIEGIPTEAMNSEITVKAFVETQTGERIYGLEKTRALSTLFD